MYTIQVVLILTVVRLGFAQKDLDFSSIGGKNTSRPFTIKVLKMICPDQPYGYTVVKTCKAKLARNQPTKLNMAVDIQRPANKLFLSYVLNYKYNTYKPLLFDDSFDLCRFMLEQGTGNNLLMNFMYQVAKSQISWLHKCPYEGLVNMTDFVLDESLMPTFLPAGDFRSDTRIFDDSNETIVYLQIFYSIRAKGLFDLSMG
ncbi:uncharacterized protein LOC135717306 [Ochlerotatus camptorhynchus]|uniref:uncharacterized protein LOC135717306 n=1 Tax=Ochlerotatus camptorhynchus TaxID=644619 RepID=UPI0031E261B0